MNSVRFLDLEPQRDLFQIALDQLATINDLVNQALKVFEEEDGSVEVVIYDIPESALAAIAVLAHGSCIDFSQP